MLQQKVVLLLVESCLKLLLIELFFKVLHLLLQCFLARDISLLQRNAVLLHLPADFHKNDELVTCTHGDLFRIHVRDKLIKLFGVVRYLNQMPWHVHVADPAEVDLALERVSDVDDEGILDELEVGGKASSYLSDYLVHYAIYYIIHSCSIIIKVRDESCPSFCRYCPDVA